MNKSTSVILAFSLGLFFCMSTNAEDPPASADNGTDPTKFTTIAEGKYEYLDLNGGFSSANL